MHAFSTLVIPLSSNAIFGLLAGAFFSSVLVWFANRRGSRRNGPYATGLFVAAFLYFIFALIGGAPSSWLLIEAAGVAVFGAVAWIGYQRMPLLLAFAWAVHVAWDVVLHLDGAGAVYTPDWYPWLCVSFDLVIAGAVLHRSLRLDAARQLQ